MQDIDISVCVANYNGESIIADCLQSIYQQKGDLRIEVIVHDDASKDNSLEILRTRFPSVELIISEQNVGFCISNNRMADQARGRYLLLLNNDATLYDDALATLYSAAQVHDDAILTLPQYDADNSQLLDCGMNIDIFANPIPIQDVGERSVAMVMGACLWISKDQWVKLGGFPEWFGSIGEDMYLCCLCRLSGSKVIALANSGYRHHVGLSFGGGKLTGHKKIKTSFKRRTLSETNKTRIILLFYPAIILAIVLPLHVALLIAEGLLLSLLSRDARILKGIYWPAVAENFKKIDKTWMQRNAIKKLKCCSTRDFFAPVQLAPHKLRMLSRYGIPAIN